MLVKPYGYWVSKDEIIDVTDDYCHTVVAQGILEERHGIPFEDIGKGADEYDLMYYFGYIRVINELDGKTSVSWLEGRKYSALQKDFIRNADYSTRAYINYERVSEWVNEHKE